MHPVTPQTWLRCRATDCGKALIISDLPVVGRSSTADVGGVEVPESVADSRLEAAYRAGLQALLVSGPASSASAVKGRPDASKVLTEISAACSPVCGTELPLCDECLEDVVSRRQREYRRKCAEVDNHRQFVSGMQDVVADGVAGDTPEVLAALLAEEEALQAEVQQLSQQLDAATSQTLAATVPGDLSRTVWRDFSDCAQRRAHARLTARGFAHRKQRYQTTLAKLQHITVHNDAFFVWYDGPFGTINTFRLGSLPAQPVYWVEINAALGQMVLLLATVSNQTGFIFSDYRMIPQGSFSKIAKTGDERTTYELYFNNRMFGLRRLNQALRCLVTCLEELAVHALENDRSLRLPYPIEDGKVGNLPVTMDREVVWTRALKYVLTDLKWLLAWATRQA